MPYVDGSKGGKEFQTGLRSVEEAWDMALDNKGILYTVLYKYLRSHSLPYYKGDALQAELEGPAWEGFFLSCLKFDESKNYKLSSFAYPSIVNAMNHRMRVLERMGSNMQGRYVKGEVVERPKLSSLEKIDEARAKQRDSEGENLLSDIMPPPWAEPEASMEDNVIEALAQEELMNKVKALVAKMSEPHKTVFELIYLTEPTHQRNPNGGGNGVGSGYTFHEVAKHFGRSTNWVREVLDDAIYYLKQHLSEEEGT